MKPFPEVVDAWDREWERSQRPDCSEPCKTCYPDCPVHRLCGEDDDLFDYAKRLVRVKGRVG